MVIVDKFTGWIDCKPTPSQSSDYTCISLFEWICQYGLMAQIHVDNGSHFNAEEVKVLMMTNYGIQIRYGVPFHPQGQGKVERANGVVKSIMKKLAWMYRQEWEVWLPAILYVMRTCRKSDHGYSSFNLVYGRQPMSVEEDDNAGYEVEIDEEELLIERIMDIIKLNKVIIPKAHRNINKYKVKMVERYNQKAKPSKFKINDLVVVLERSQNDKDVVLLTRWTGPFRVAEVVGKNVYNIKDGELRLPYAYHANQLKLYKPRPRLSTSIFEILCQEIIYVPSYMYASMPLPFLTLYLYHSLCFRSFVYFYA